MSRYLPPNWAEARLEDLLAPQSDGRLIHQGWSPQCDKRASGGGAEWGVLKTTAVQDGLFLPQHNKHLPSSLPPKPELEVRRGDILITCAGPRSRCGVACFVRTTPPHLMLSGKIYRFGTPAGLVDPLFLEAQLREVRTLRAIDQIKTGGDDSGLNLTQDRFRSLPVIIAPFEEQKRIVAKIEELTARSRRAKEALDAVPALLDQLRQSILAAAFRGDLTADWRSKNADVEPAEKLVPQILAERRSGWESTELAKLVAKGKRPTDERWKEKYRAPEAVGDDELPHLPHLWCWTTLDALAWDGPSNGYSPKSDNDATGSPTLRLGATTQGHLVLNEGTTKRIFETVPSNSDYWLRPGDLLIQRANSLEHVGTAAIYDGPADTYIYPDLMMRLRLVRCIESRLVWRFLNSTWVRNYFRSKATGTAGNMPKINGETVRTVPIPLPPRAEQAILSVLVANSFAALDRLAATVEDLQARSSSLDASFLAKAFRGELVTQDPTDEPATVLLERIRAAREASSRGAKSRGRSRDPEFLVDAADDDDKACDHTRLLAGSNDARRATNDLSAVGLDTLHQAVFAALWTHGPMEKDDAIRKVADYLRDNSYVKFQRLRSDGPLYVELLELIESAVKKGLLDRPKRGRVRACKSDAMDYSPDDWRHALVNSLGTEPTDRDEAIRAAAEWAREILGLEYARLRADGHIVENLRSAINSAIRRGDVTRIDPKRISRTEHSESVGPQPEVTEIGSGSGTVEDASTGEGEKRPIIERSLEPLQLDGAESVLVLQMGEFERSYDALRLAIQGVSFAISASGLPNGSERWRFFLGFECPHVEGLSTWLGISRNVPLKSVDLIQRLLEAAGQRVHREHAVVAAHHLEPFLVAAESGLETPTRGSIVLDDDDLAQFEVPRVVRRPFVVNAARARANQELTQLLLGPDQPK